MRKKKKSLALNFSIPFLDNFLPKIPSHSSVIHTAFASDSAWNKERFILFFRSCAFTEVHVMCVKIKHCGGFLFN